MHSMRAVIPSRCLCARGSSMRLPKVFHQNLQISEATDLHGVKSCRIYLPIFPSIVPLNWVGYRQGKERDLRASSGLA